MGGDEFLDMEFFEGLDGFCDALGTCVCEVHSADDGVDGAILSELSNVEQGVNNASVGAAEEDNDAFRGVEEKRLVIEKWIGFARVFIQEECAARVFKFGDSWNFSRSKDTGNDFCRRGYQLRAFSEMLFAVGIEKWNTDLFDFATFVFQKFFLKCCGMQKNRSRSLFHGEFKSADVIVMSVAQYDGICLG